MSIWAFIFFLPPSSNLYLVPSVPRYEEEVALRATAENEFVVLKKVSDPAILRSKLTRSIFAGPWRPVLLSHKD